MTEHNLFYYPHASFTNVQLSLLKMAALGKKGWDQSRFTVEGERKMITKLLKDHIVKQTPCGEIHEILLGSEYSPDIAIAPNIGPTKAHYHTGFDEVYFVLDGDLVLQLYDPESGGSTEQKLGANELCVITKGIHHKITKSSTKNRLCVITVPRFDASDEHPSEVI